ncbi:hypothetical protein [Campylobacter sp.]|uniref:hypothetical protein n=1 Tax=Campylobacter sp. TaxID=205 RepID=UPI002A91F73A|nr:hypothetical protein [Campylobacter sp.]
MRGFENAEAISFKIPSKIPKPCVILGLDHNGDDIAFKSSWISGEDGILVIKFFIYFKL